MSNAENFSTFCSLDIVMIFSSNLYDKSGPTCIKTAFSELFCHQKFSWVVRTRNFWNTFELFKKYVSWLDVWWAIHAKLLIYCVAFDPFCLPLKDCTYIHYVLRVLKTCLWDPRCQIYVFESRIAYGIYKWVQNNQFQTPLSNDFFKKLFLEQKNHQK